MDTGYLIELPIGTEKRGLHLAPPHGELIYQGRKTAVAKARPFDISGPWILISGGMAYGTLDVGLPEPVSAEEFDKRFSEHRVTYTERKRWWPSVEQLWLSPIRYFEAFEKPYPVTVQSGMQTVVEQVEFPSEQPACLGEHCDEVRLVLEEVTLARGQKQRDAKQTSTPEAAQEQEDAMPYDPENPPERLRAMPEKAQRMWVHAFNACMEKRDDDGRCSQIAYGAVKNAGYYQTEDGAWHKKEAEMPPNSDEVIALQPGSQQDATKQGEDEDEDIEGTSKGTAEDNNLPDSAFLYVEPGGEKDDEGKTAPRSLRHLPYKKADGSIDGPRLRNALGRLGQAKTGTGEDKWITESLRARLIAKAQRILDEHNKQAGGAGADRECVCSECGATAPHEVGVPCTETSCPECGAAMYGRTPDGAKALGLLPTLRDRFESILGDVRGWLAGTETPEQAEPQAASPSFVGFKTLKAKDGRLWLQTWTTNAFEDRDEELFATKAIEDFVDRHEADGQKGEFWFWHLPGAKMGTIHWQAVVGRFLVQMGPFDDTPMGRKWAEFFGHHPAGHPTIAPEGWGTSHGFWYDEKDRDDGVYDWFDSFETTVLPLAAASNPYTQMEVLAAMNDAQKSALQSIGSELGIPNLVQVITETGEQRTKELEEQGTRYKAQLTVAPPEVEPVPPVAPEAQAVVEPAEAVKAEQPEAASSAIKQLAEHIAESLHMPELADAVSQLHKALDAVSAEQKALAERLGKLEDIGADASLPLVPLRAAYHRAALAGPEPSDKALAAATPRVPDVIVEMAKHVPYGG